MAQRQGRRSLGLAPAPLSGGPKEVGELSEAQRFEDFRRRHSKQNKDIIMDNIARKAVVKSLQDEIATLSTELLQVRQANLVLQARVKRMQREAGKMHGQSARDALDHLLSAVPALKQLRDSLSLVTAPSNQIEQNKNNQFAFLDPVENTYATRPAAVGAQAQGLLALIEGSESEGSESGNDERGTELDLRRVGGRSRGRQTGVGSVAASRSPRPPALTVSHARTSPRKHSSPSPRKPASMPRKNASSSPRKHASASSSASISGPKAQRRRRESGLILPPPRSPSPESVTTPQVQSELEEIPDYIESSDWEEGKGIVLEADGANFAQSDFLEKKAHVGMDRLGGQVIIDVPMPDEPPHLAMPKVKNPMNAVKEESEGSGLSQTTSSSEASVPPANGTAESAEEPARGRRARSSVCYKEPSLNKKMRKPDGVNVEDVLKPVSRKSMAPPSSSSSNTASRPGSPRSDSPPPPVPALPPAHPFNPDDQAYANQTSARDLTARDVRPPRQPSSAASASVSARALGGGMRRKSTLPRHGAKAINYMEVESDEEVDGLVGYPDLDAEEDEVEVGRGMSKLSITGDKARSSSGPSKSAATSTPTTDPRTASATGSVSSSNIASTRKPTGVGMGRPVMPPSSASGGSTRVPSASSRHFTPTPSGASGQTRTSRTASNPSHTSADKRSEQEKEKEKERDGLGDRGLHNVPPRSSPTSSSSTEFGKTPNSSSAGAGGRGSKVGVTGRAGTGTGTGTGGLGGKRRASSAV